MELTPETTNILLSYIVLQDLLGDLIPKGEKCGSKQGIFLPNVDQSKVFSQGEEAYPKGGEIPK